MPYCSALDNHMCVTVDSRWRPCCRFKDFGNWELSEITFDEYRDNSWYQNIRNEMKTGWHNGCNKCMEEEAREHTSLRQTMNDIHEQDGSIQSIEISLSNKCNLACRMCSPTYSSFWGRLLDNNNSLAQWHSQADAPLINVADALKGIDLTKLKRIKYLGGEPFITPEIGQLFEYLDDKGVIEQLEFTTNTNGTLFPYKWIKHLKKFNRVTLEISIDGIGSVNDYIRHGKTWSTIEKNIEQWCKLRDATDNLTVSSYTTVQALNLHNIQEIKTFVNNKGFHFHSSLLAVPEFLSTHVLPRNYLAEIHNEYNDRYYKSIQDHTHLWREFVRYNQAFDKATASSLKRAIPELYKYMEIK